MLANAPFGVLLFVCKMTRKMDTFNQVSILRVTVHRNHYWSEFFTRN